MTATTPTAPRTPSERVPPPGRERPRGRRLVDGVRLGMVAALLSAVAWWALPTAIQAGDAGEFATVLLRGGVPHPPGYPLMRALGPAAGAARSLLDAPASAAALPCALFGVAAWLLVLDLLQTRGIGWPAALAVALCGTAPVVQRHVPDSEVWGLHLFVIAALIRHALGGRPRPFVLGLLFGLGLSQHLTAILLAPLAIGAVFDGVRGRSDRAVVACALALLGVALGLVPYATLALGGGAWRWGDTTTFAGWLHHVTRADYGTFALGLRTDDPELPAQLARAIRSVADAIVPGSGSWTVLATIVLAALVVLGGRNGHDRVPRATGAGWLVALAASGLVFPALGNVDPVDARGAWILERFDLMTLLLLCPIAALAFAAVIEAASNRVQPALWSVLGVTAIGLQLARTDRAGVPSQERAIETYALDLLATPAPGRAVIVGTDDHRIFPILYAQEVLGAGAEVVYVDASLLSRPWYRRQLQRRFPALPDVEKPVQLLTLLQQQPATRDLPMYVTHSFSAPVRELELVPEGLLWRVVPPHDRDRVGDLRAVHARHVRALSTYAGPLRGTETTDPFARDLTAAYFEGTHQLANALRASDLAELAQRLEDPP